MENLPYADKISRITNPWNWTDESGDLMVRACREMATYHSDSNTVIREIYKRKGFNPQDITAEADLHKIPALGVSAMKAHLLTSLPHDRAILKLTSSGTKGEKTQIWFDEASLNRVQGMLDVLWQQQGLVSKDPANYLMMIYDPGDAKDLGTAFTRKNHQRFAPVNREHYAVKKNPDGQWAFNAGATLQTLREYAEENLPVRILGIPIFIFELLVALEKQNIRLNLHPESMVMTGGGWKAAEDRSIGKDEFRLRLSTALGIRDERIRDGYGMAEHSAPYMECRMHRFHVPAFNRVFALDPVTMRPVKNGEAGLLKLLTPYNAMMPNLSILSTDVGRIDESPCGCGHLSPTFTMIGRGGISKHRGCALQASEIVRKK